jgi:mRNA interferase RelE/StbE
VREYRVALTSSAERELSRLPNEFIARIVSRIELLAKDPRPRGSKKLRGGNSEWRIRVGNYRAIYTIDDKIGSVEVTRIAHRQGVYE